MVDGFLIFDFFGYDSLFVESIFVEDICENIELLFFVDIEIKLVVCFVVVLLVVLENGLNVDEYMVNIDFIC